MINVLAESTRYLLRGFRMTAERPRLFVSIAFIFSLPAFLAAALAALVPGDAAWRAPVLFLLQSVTTAVAPAVFMMAVSAAYAGEQVSTRRVISRAIPWLPRYLWTNVHTTLVFWVPMGCLVLLRSLLDSAGATQFVAVDLTWWAVVLLAALVLHSRTLLAPFLAVHGDLPATLAAWEAWRLSGRRLPLIAITLLLTSAPVAVPLVLGVLLSNRFYPGAWSSEVLPQLTGVGLQLIRLIVVPAFYMMYRDLWYGPVPDHDVAERPPRVLRGLMALTAWVPYRRNRVETAGLTVADSRSSR